METLVAVEAEITAAIMAGRTERASALQDMWFDVADAAIALDDLLQREGKPYRPPPGGGGRRERRAARAA